MSLEEISSATKISLRFLDAIEREDFSKLPGGIFSRSFIRSYARYLGLDEERIVAEFQLAARPEVEFDLHRMTGSSSSARPSSRTPLIAMLVAGVLLAGGYVLFRYSPRSGETPLESLPAPTVKPKPAATPAVPAPAPSSPVTAAPVVNPVAGAGAPGGAPATSPAMAPGNTAHPQGGLVTGAKPTAPSATQMGTPPGTSPVDDNGLVLQIAATERAWVAVDADGKTVLQRVLNPNEVETLKAHKSFDLTTGNAQAVILTLNGETLKPLGRRGEVKSIHLTREEPKNPAP